MDIKRIYEVVLSANESVHGGARAENLTGPIYSDAVAELVERLQGRETLDFEVKAARGGLPNSIWPTVSAFANTAGGWLILGVAERDGRLVVEGVPNAADQMQQLSDLLRNPQRINPSPCGANDLSQEEIGGLQVVVLRVPPAARRSRPVCLNNNPYAGTYVRRQSGDHQCTRAEVDRMMREAADLAADHVILRGYTWDDLDHLTFDGYRQRFRVQNPASPFNRLNDQQFLTQIGGWTRDRETGQEGITVAGLLMFGTEEAIRSWRPRHLIDYRWLAVTPDRVDPIRWQDRLVHEGNLLDAFDAIYERASAQLAVPFATDGPARTSETPQRVALREALVNLIVHADYRERDASIVLQHPQGFRFRNPGDSRVPNLNDAVPDRSDPRNPTLVRMFRLIGLADEAGTGVPRIVDEWRRAGFELPSFETGEDRYEFRLDLRNVHLLAEGDLHWLEEFEGQLSDAERLALVTARHNGLVDNASLRDLTGLQVAEVTKVLGGLRDRGLLRMRGAKRGAWYELGAEVPEPAEDRHQLPIPGFAAGQTRVPGNRNESSEGLPSSSGGLSGSSEGLPSSSGGLSGSSEGLPAADELKRLSAEVSGKGKVANAHLKEVILKLCSVTPLSLDELASLLDRSKDHLRGTLRQLINEGALKYEFPLVPQHPRQRYIAVAPLNEAFPR